MGNSVTLHSACAYGDLAAVRALLTNATAADLEAKDDSGRTPLLVAVASMTFKGDEDDDDDDIFGDGFRDDHSEESEGGNATRQDGDSLIANDTSKDSGDDDGDDDDSDPEEVEDFNANLEPLSKQAEILHLLMQKHVNLDHQDENGWTALHHACFVQNPVAIKMLIHAGAHPMREKFGLLPQVRTYLMRITGFHGGFSNSLVRRMFTQDFLLRGQSSAWIAQAQDLKETLDIITDKSLYTIKLLAFRPSGIVQLDMGGQVEKGSLVTSTPFDCDAFSVQVLLKITLTTDCYFVCIQSVEYDVPENHSVKDYIQVLISEESSSEIEIGSYHYVPAGKHGQITISTQSIPSSSTVRFVYVKCGTSHIFIPCQHCWGL